MINEYTDFLSKWNELKKTIHCKNYVYKKRNDSSEEYDGKY